MLQSSLRTTPHLHDRISAASVRDRAVRDRHLRHALADLAREVAAAADGARDVQLVVQLVRAPGYPAFKAARTADWAAAPWSAGRLATQAC